MKRKITAIILMVVLVLALAIPMAAPAAAHLEGAPFITVLVADGGSEATHVDVGTVSVWNDSENLYVKYETIDGWEMTATHLEVATLEEDIPQTKKTGNPKVGKFSEGDSYATPVTEDTFTFNLVAEGWSPETPLFIAAHADVQKLSDVITATLATGNGTDNVLVIAEGSPNYPVGYPGPSYGGTPSPAVLTWVHPLWPSLAGAQWISSALNVENPPPNSWRLFTRNFSVPSNAVNLSGTLQITSDNAEEVGLNGSPVGTDGEVYGPFIDNQEWKTILSHAVSPQPESNTLEVMVRNYAGSSSPTSNPTGLIYKMDYEYQLLRTETAWGGWYDGTRFTLKGNWARYFTYEVQPDLGDTGDSTAVWSTEEPHSGSYSYHLTTAGAQGSEARIKIWLPSGTTLGDIDSISWWVWAVAGYPPHVDITLDSDNNPSVVNNDEMLTAEFAYNNVSAPAWSPTYGAWLETFETTSSDGFGSVNTATTLWVTKMGAGILDAPSGTLAEWQAGTVGSDPFSEITAGDIDGSAKILYIEIEIDNWIVQSEAYVDDIAITLS